MYTTLLMIHIGGAIVGLLSGFLAMLFRKGSGLHGAAGSVFFVSMLSMSAAGAYLAAFIKPNIGNVVGGILTFYLVATAWVAARRREHKVGLFDWTALTLVSTLATADFVFGLQAAGSRSGLKAGYPAAMYFIFGTIAALFAASDIRMLVRGGVSGARRIARHLWRMCFALFIALMSFYPSRARLFSPEINRSGVLYLPHLLLVAATIYWLVRVRARKRVPQERGIAAQEVFQS